MRKNEKLFIRFLKENNIYVRFLKYCTRYRGKQNIGKYIRKYCSDEYDVYCLISSAFNWGQTFEGYEFWFQISKKWGKVLNYPLYK